MNCQEEMPSTYKSYRSGHMMYLRNEDLITVNEDLRTFIMGLMAQGKVAKND